MEGVIANDLYQVARVEDNERIGYALGYSGAERWETVLPADSLGDLIDTLTASVSAPRDSLTRGTVFQVERVAINRLSRIQWLGQQAVGALFTYEDRLVQPLIDLLVTLQMEFTETFEIDLDGSRTFWRNFKTKVKEAIDDDALEGAVQAEIDSQYGGALNTLSTGLGSANANIAKVRDQRLDLVDFGAVGDGVANDTAAVQAAFDAAIAQGRAIFSPPGKEYLVDPLTVSAPMQLEGAFTFSARTTGQSHVISLLDDVDWSRARVYINGKNRALYGVRGANFGRSGFGYLDTQRCSIWGMQFDPTGNNNVVNVDRFAARLNGAKVAQTLTETAETANGLTSTAGYGSFTLSTPLTAAQIASNVIYFVISGGLAYKVRSVTATTIEVFNLKAGSGVGGKASQTDLDTLTVSFANQRILTSEDWGIADAALTPAQRAQKIQEFWNYCATNKYLCLMLPGTYIVDHFATATRVDGILTVPAGIDLHFRAGFKLQRAPFVEATVVAQKRVLIIGSQSNGATLSGTLEIDGAGDSVTWYNEHNHCLFIFAAQNVDARRLRYIGRNAMGDCLSFSGSNSANLTKNVWVGTVELYNARRKSLVVESTVNCGIDHAYLDNPVTTGGCFDYEPLGIAAGMEAISFHIGTLHSLGPVDFTAGTARTVAQAVLTGDTWHIIARSGQTTANYTSYGVNVAVTRILLDARQSAATAAGILNLTHTTFFNVLDLEIITSNTVANTAGAIVTSPTASGTPSLNVGKIRLSGATDITASILAAGRIGVISVYGKDAPSAQVVIGSYGAPNVEVALYVDTVQFNDCYNASHLLAPHANAGTERITHISRVDHYQSDGRVSPCLYKALTLAGNQRIIGDLSKRGGGVTNLVDIFPGAVPLMRVKNFPEEAHYHGSTLTWTPEGVYTAPAGSRVLHIAAGKLWMKTTDGTLNTGWVQL